MEKCGQYRAAQGVSPIWKKGYGIIWIDISARKIITYNPTTKQEQVYDALGWLKSIVPLADGRFIGVYKDGLYNLNFKKGVRSPFSLFNNLNDIHYLSNAKSGPDGHLWVSSTDGFYKRFKESPYTTSSQYPFENSKIYSVNSIGSIEKRVENISILSGFDWNRDTNDFYYIDRLKNIILHYECGIDFELKFKKVMYSFSNEEGQPVDMTIDKQGNLWVALTRELKTEEHSTSTVVCIDHESLTIIQEVKVPVTYISSILIGGEKLQTLFITTDYEQLSMAKIKQESCAGYLLGVEIEQQGVPAYEFAVDVEGRVNAR